MDKSTQWVVGAVVFILVVTVIVGGMVCAFKVAVTQSNVVSGKVNASVQVNAKSTQLIADLNAGVDVNPQAGK